VLSHALDHLTELDDDLGSIPPVAGDWQPPAGFEAGVRALAAWLEATKDPEAEPAPAIFTALEEASKQLSAERRRDARSYWQTSHCNARLRRQRARASS
jgi:phosphate:Na+ symporter